MCGALRSGKTHIAKLLFKNIRYVSPDMFLEHGKWTKEKSDRAWDKTHDVIKKHILNKEDFVVDTASARGIVRQKLVQFIRQISSEYKIICIYVKCPLGDCIIRYKKRKEKRESEEQIKKYFKFVEENPPSKKDGYDEIITIDNSIRYDEDDKPQVLPGEWKEGWYHNTKGDEK